MISITWQIYLLGIFLAGFLPGSSTLLIFFLNKKTRVVETVEKSTQVQDTYFKQAVELASQYREELGRLRAIVDGLEKKLTDQEVECNRKIALLQEQINSLISQLQTAGRKSALANGKE